jgi:branched-chain amino acid transport system permease protein
VIRIIVVLAAVAMMVALGYLVLRTRLGKAMRSTAYDREAAAMMGIDVDRVIASTFFIGSALAGAAGVLIGLVFGQINHFMGFSYGLKGFTAAVVGGIGSIPGAMLGGLLIGLAEAYTVGYLTSSFRDVIVFSILIVFLLVRPNGIMGRPAVKKV